MSKPTQDQTLRSPEEDPLFERRGRRLTMHRRLFFFGEGEFEGEATVLDISTNGCKATSLTEVKVGQSLKLSLFLQDQQWPLRIDHALVRWVDGQSFWNGIHWDQARTARTAPVYSDEGQTLMA